jgi:hypothetical protein
MVREGLAGGWLEDITPEFSTQPIAELLDLADQLVGFTLVEGTKNRFLLNLEYSGIDTTTSCYRDFFGGRVDMAYAI